MTIEHLCAEVLDHGRIALIDAMPAEPGGGDARIVQAARVSLAHLPSSVHDIIGNTRHADEVRDPGADAKLIHYMLKHRHNTPFEKVRFEFFIEAPIFVARQWFRYRTGSFNEQSARYSELADKFYIPSIERMQEQSKDNRQGSGERIEDDLARDMQTDMAQHCQAAYELYKGLLKDGLTRELARAVLPVNIYTSWYWTVDLRNLFNFFTERLDNHAQYEIRAYAEAILPMVKYIAPIALSAYFLEIVAKEKY